MGIVEASINKKSEEEMNQLPGVQKKKKRPTKTGSKIPGTGTRAREDSLSTGRIKDFLAHLSKICGRKECRT